MNKQILVFSLLVFALINVNFAQDDNSSLPEVKIAGTQLLKIHSSIVNQDYDLYINLPRFFDDSTKTFPIIYLLDAQWDFPLLNGIYGEQYYDGFLPEAIIVGITWGGINPNPDILRRRDFTPSKEGNNPVGGGAEKFLSFIKKELIPFIDSTFRTKPGDRTLMGSSLGGLFTLYAMFNETELFNNYILTSPAIGWSNGIINSYEKKFTDPQKPIKLSMAIGGYEDVDYFQKFVENLKEKNYPGLKLNSFVIDGIGHSGGKAEGFTRGLQFVFDKGDVFVEPDILKKYTGTYQIPASFQAKIHLEDNHLFVDIPGNGDRILYASNNTDFYIIGQYLKVHFQNDDEGNITGLQVETYDNKFFMKKVD